MRLSKKQIIGGLSVGVAIIGIWLIFRKKKDKTDLTNYQPTSGGGLSYTPPKSAPVRNDNFPLKKGSKGARVTELQKIILSYNANILPNYGADGDFGSETEAALLSISGKKTVDNQSELDALRYSKNRFY